MTDTVNSEKLPLRGDIQLPERLETSSYSKKKQIIAALCATLGCLLNGAVIGYTGPAIPDLMNLKGDEGRTIWSTDIKLSAQEASWITGLLSIGCFVGCIAAGPTMETFGRKIALLVFTSGLYILGFLLILLAYNAGMVLAGRFFNGMGLGFVLAVTSVYIMEIATTDMRGILGSFIQFLGSIGVLIIFSAGCFLNWFQMAGLMVGLAVPFIVGMFFCPESPRWLLIKGKKEEARKSLIWLRGDDRATIEEELRRIENNLKMETENNNNVSGSDWKSTSVMKPFLISIFMMLFLQTSGMNVMIFYCNPIFYFAKVGISEDVGTVIVGVVLLSSCFVAIICITRLPRRVILIASMSGMAVCYFSLGGCFYVLETEVYQFEDEALREAALEALNYPSWIPVLSILLLLFLGNGGYGTLIWIMTSELLPPRVRSQANAIIICFSFIMGFIISKTFVDLVTAAGAYGAFWTYGAFCLVGTIFTVIFVPETKGKSVEEIADMFN